MKRSLLLALVPLVAVACGETEPPDPAPPPCEKAPGVICTVAGTGIAGDGTDLLAPRATMLYSPADVAFTPQGRLVVIDWNNHRIRAVQDDGKLKIVAGEGELSTGLLGDEVGNRLNHPTDVTFDPEGRMVIAAWHNSRVKRVDPTTGALEDIAGTGARGYDGDNGPALMAILNLPASVLYDPQGNLLVSDQANQRIRMIDRDGKITTIAGTGKRGYGGDGGPALEAMFNLPVGQQGHPAAHIVRHPTTGDLYLADTDNNRIRRIDGNGMVSTVAGTGDAGTAGLEGPALDAQLDHPVDVAIGPDGDLYIVDTLNNCVRVVRQGVISTIAGKCGPCGTTLGEGCLCPARDAACIGDGRPARQASLKRPNGIAFDAEGNLYIADTLNHRVRVVYR